MTMQISLISTQHDLDLAHQIRHQVFVIEQKVDPEIEYDEYESASTHILARNESGEAVGTARWRQTDHGWKLERFAVLESARGLGIGSGLMEFVLDHIDHKLPIYLNSQTIAIPFYEKLGFRATGDIFYEANIPHRKMLFSEP